MSVELAFIGDIHGNLRALRGLWEVLTRLDVHHVVFLGDYLNKGTQSAQVLEELISLHKTGRVTLLAGNHETALLHALDNGDLAGFLKMGGAATVRSYVGGHVGPDVLSDLRARIPDEHLEAIRHMPLVYETDDLIARHLPLDSATTRFTVSAHTPVGDLPRVSPQSAQLDTGCGGSDGRLTALLWPTCEYIQVAADGVQIHRTTTLD